MELNEVSSVLFVDDDEEIVRTLSSCEISKELNVFTANSGESAIKIINCFQIDLIISDFEMANGDGLMLLNFVKTLKCRPIFYFFSGEGFKLSMRKNELGFDGVFTKPYELENVFSLLKSLKNPASCCSI